MWKAGSSGPPPVSRSPISRTATRRFSRKGGRSSAAATTASTPIRRSPFPRKTISSCAASPSPTTPEGSRTIDVTSYAEVVLASPAADALHPAFSNLFVQTEILRRERAIFCTRRPRSQGEASPCLFHLMAVQGADIGEISYETDRMQFIGRGNTVANPQAMAHLSDLSGSEGSVLDPIVAIRYRLTLDPEEKATVSIVTGVGETREAALGLVEKYQDRRLADRVFDLAWTHSQVLLRQINATEADAQLYGRLAGSVIYANASLRADAGILLSNRRGQSGLWGYAISGDLPIVLLSIEDPANIELVRQLVQAHAYWRLKGLAVDLVIWNEDHAGYRQLLHDQIMGLIAAGIEANVTDNRGAIFVRPADQISEEDRILIQTVARVIIADSRGSLADQLNRQNPVDMAVPRLTASRAYRAALPAVTALPRPDLMFFNGLGGFTPDGREYIVTTAPLQVTPAPWVNVLANPHFGTVVSESGSAYTWAENAHEFRLTPWHNDPVSDPSGEAFYIRDDERGHFWSPMPLPSRGMTPYVTRHGFGYSVFEHAERGIRSEAWVYVATDAPVKFTVLKIKNESGRARRLSVTGYAEWVLGDLRSKTAMHVVTEVRPCKRGALRAEPLQYGVSRPDRLFRRRRRAADVQRRPDRVSGPQRHAHPSRGDGQRAALRQGRRRPGPLRRNPDLLRTGRRAGAGDRLHAGRGAGCRHGPPPGASFPRIGGGTGRAGGGVAVLETHARRRPGGDA